MAMKLFLDSSTAYLILGLVDDNNKIISFSREGKNDHSETLIDYLKSFLTDNNYQINDITDIFIGRGPGSYTGLRISGVVGKVLAYLKNINLYSFSSLDFIGCSFKGHIIPLTDAKRDHSYYKVIDYFDEYQIIHDESFEENKIIKDQYPDYDIYNIDDIINNNLINKSIEMILKEKLYREESNLDYNPNYIRSGI